MEYSYWQIESLGIYGLDNAMVESDALSGAVTITPNGYNAPTVTYKQSSAEEEHIIKPELEEVVLPSRIVYSSSYPNDDWRTLAEESVDEILCKNDSLIINSETIMSDEEVEKETQKPIPIPVGLELIGDNVLYKENIVIPREKANQEYSAIGKVKYKPIVEINVESPDLEYEIDLSSIMVHTPTVSDGMIESKISENQMISPTYGISSLVLDKPFYATLSTYGSHRFIKGYGYRDYSKYIEEQSVRFPFDVYKGSSTSGIFIPKNTWTSYFYGYSILLAYMG